MRVLSRSCSILLALAVVLTAFLSTTSSAQPPGAVRELEDLRTATSKHWQNTDGSITAELFSGPVHFRDVDDTWKEIDTRLTSSTRSGFSYSVLKNTFKTYFAPDAKGWHKIELGGIGFSFAADAINAADTVSEGSSVTYTNAWPMVDLKYTVLPSGVKEEIVLKEKLQSPVFRFTVRPDGLRPVTVGRGIDFVDVGGNAKVRIPGPFMEDANGETSDLVDATWTASPDGSVELTIQPDMDWLDKAAYPVTIDPTITPNTGDGKDVYYHIFTTTNTGTRYDTSTSLHCGGNSGTKYVDHACIIWDIEDAGIPTNAVLSDAYIEFSSFPGGGGGYPVCLRRISIPFSSWSSTTLPSTGSIIQSVTWSSTGTNTYSGDDIESLVQDWVWYPDNNYGAKWSMEVFGADCIFYASESTLSSYRPKLVLTYTVDDTDPSFENIKAEPFCAMVGQTVTISFTASEPLRTSPTPAVTVNSHAASTVTKDGDIYSCEYTIQSTDNPGAATIVITGTDLPGNEGSTTNTTALWVTQRGYTYNDTTGSTTVTNANGTSCVYEFDERFRLVKIRN